MTERRLDYPEIHERLASLETISSNIREDIHQINRCLSGNGRPGFIKETQDEIYEIKTSIIAKEAVDKAKENAHKKSVGLWGLAVTGAVGVVELLVHGLWHK